LRFAIIPHTESVRFPIIPHTEYVRFRIIPHTEYVHVMVLTPSPQPGQHDQRTPARRRP
jgi:hypothetical protein